MLVYRLNLALDGRHVVVARTDRMGDMILTGPLFSGIKEFFPQARLSVLASRANCEIAALLPAIDAVEVDPVEARDSGWRGTIALARRLRQLKIDVLLFGNAKRRLAISAWLARIPVRVGKARHAYSMLYTARLPSVPGEHETDWTLRLLQPFGVEPVRTAPRWPVAQGDRRVVDTLLYNARLAPGRPVAMLHSGNSGNALTASPFWYARLGDALSAAGYALVLTGTAADRQRVRAIAAAMRHKPLDLTGNLTVGELAALCARSAVCIANSTGPAHIAAAVGTPTIGLYAPQRKQQRWLPRGRAVKVVQPDLGMNCGPCLGPHCPFFNCMDRVSAETVLAAVADVRG